MGVMLQKPQLQHLKSYLSFIDEMRGLGEKVWHSFFPSTEETDELFIARLLRAETAPLSGLVPETTYWAIEDGQVLGRIALRHALNQDLEEFGGNIGYEVRPSARKRGIATEMLKQILETPKAKQIGRVLLTCAPANLASNRTIQKNGGVLTKCAFVAKWRRETNYYWITLT
jgi:predicted acetyltransferase